MRSRYLSSSKPSIDYSPMGHPKPEHQLATLKFLTLRKYEIINVDYCFELLNFGMIYKSS
jgi:hypothetical protein